ncbi:unnamed protein product [Scytosiphon promiscuus]
MCIANRVAAMFRSMSSCSSCGDSNPPGRGFDDDHDQDLPMLAPPALGLSRQETRSAATATPPSAPFATSSDFQDGSNSPYPSVSERLKPHPFRRKDPPLHVQASVRGDRQELEKWLVSGGDANIRDDDGWALLHHASMHGREECVELLLRYGARHDRVAIGGHTVLHLASANRHCEVVKRLVEAGALINPRNAHGNTPLHSAAATGTIDVLVYLLSQSADPDAINSVGETPDEVSGATSEAVDVIVEARRLKQARIAQRFALVKIHKLWNAGRAEPIAAHRVPSPAAMEVTTSDTFEGGESTKPARPEAQRPCATVPAASAVGGVAGSARAGRLTYLGGEDENEVREEERRLTSLGSTVSAIAVLPQEVLRRVVSYCTL